MELTDSTHLKWSTYSNTWHTPWHTFSNESCKENNHLCQALTHS